MLVLSVVLAAAAPHAFRDCPGCPEMVVVPAGSFAMGSLPSEPGHTFTEAPRHRVRVRTFAIGRYAVTFAQWDACVASGGCGGYRPADAGWGRGDRPVINVRWLDAARYAAWLRKRTGRAYRLPSEAEWEYAARAGTSTPFSFGTTIATSQANFDGRYPYAGGARGAFRGRTLPGGAFAANAFGVHDMNGNVAEWVADCLHADYTGAPADARAWVSGDCGERVVRGGSWASEARLVRSAMRFAQGPSARNTWVGFRVAADL